MPLPSIIAIDGPAASGKTTLGKRLADHLGYLFFDTGIMYRAVTWLALQNGVSLDDSVALADLAERADIDLRPASVADHRSVDVLVDDQDVTWDIRTPEVDANVSQVSAHPSVRRALSNQQRKIGKRGQVVMVGRDIGTVVLPDADLKIYLDASAEERARRRFEEMRNRGEAPVFEEVLESVRFRDHIDSTRDVAPLRAAEDAVVIDSDGLDAESIFAIAQNLVAESAEPR